MDAFKDFKDDLDAIYSPKAPATEGVVWFEEACRKCNGTGVYHGFSRHGRACFACGGKGKMQFKTSPEQRAKAKQYAENHKVKQAEKKAANVQAWLDANKAEAEWLLEAAGRGFEFAVSLQAALHKYGSLTDGQLAAVRKCVIASAERMAKRAAEKVEAEKTAPQISIEAIEVAFNKAKEAGIRYPRLRLDTFVFTPAASHGKNPGAVYVKSGEQYLGKILGGKLYATRECPSEASERIVAAASDPHAAAVAYGKKFGCCAVCGRELTEGGSIERGIGPVCAEKYGW